MLAFTVRAIFPFTPFLTLYNLCRRIMHYDTSGLIQMIFHISHVSTISLNMKHLADSILWLFNCRPIVAHFLYIDCSFFLVKVYLNTLLFSF